MSGVDEHELSESVARAFGRAPADLPLSDAVAKAFGHSTVGEESLVSDLVSAGFTESGARGVVSRLDAGFSADLAVRGTGFTSQHAPVSERVCEAAMGVLSRHGRGEEVVEDAGPSAALMAARDQLATAYAATSRTITRESANRYADAALTQCLESAVRTGWSEEQMLELLTRQRSLLEARRGGRR